MKTRYTFAIALLLVGCGQSVDDSRTVVNSLDPNTMAEEVERSVSQQAQAALQAEEFGEFECVDGDSMCWIDGHRYTCGFDGEAYDYFETGAQCDNRALLEFDRRDLVVREFGPVAPWIIDVSDRDDTDPAVGGATGTSDPPSNGGSGSSGGDLGGASGGQGGSSGGSQGL